MVRLGSGGGDMKRLTPDAIDRGVAALERLPARSPRSTAPRSARSPPARSARPRTATIPRRARDEAGVDVEVISGCRGGPPHPPRRAAGRAGVRPAAAAVDIGGGSTEVLVGERGEILAARSLKLGAIRLTRRFFPDDTTPARAVDAVPPLRPGRCSPRCQREIDTASRSRSAARAPIEAVAAMALAARRRRTRPATLNQRRDHAQERSAAVVEALLGGADGRTSGAASPGLDAARADIILAGALILEEVVDELRHRRADRSPTTPCGRACCSTPASARHGGVAPPPARPPPPQRAAPGRADGRGARALGPRRPRWPSSSSTQLGAVARPRRRRPRATSRRPPCSPTWGCSSPTASTTSTATT